MGAIAGVTEMTSTSSLGNTSIVIQFDLSRSVEGAARDVQAAINAAGSDLPPACPTRRRFRKADPGDAPVLIMAMSSETVSPGAVYDAADSVAAQRIAQVRGVAQVIITGAEQPAIRITVDPAAAKAAGVALETLRRRSTPATSTRRPG